MDLKEDRLNSLNSIFFKSRNNDMEFVRVTIADRFVVGLLLTPNFNNNLQNSLRQ